MSFKDLFSRQSSAYSRYRPGYPSELIEYVAGLSPGRELAVDGSRSQLGGARPHPRVHYAAALAERLPLRTRGTSLVAAAQAAHWFDVDRFYTDVIGRDWPAERCYVEQDYRTLPFPWAEEPAPRFELVTDWDLEQVMGYIATWSAVQRCRERTGEDPLPALRPQLAGSWPGGATRRLHWPIHLRIGRHW